MYECCSTPLFASTWKTEVIFLTSLQKQFYKLVKGLYKILPSSIFDVFGFPVIIWKNTYIIREYQVNLYNNFFLCFKYYGQDWKAQF